MHGGLAMTKRFPEIAPQGTLEETSVLDYPRIVEAHCRPKTRHVLGRRVGRQEQRRRVTGQVQDHEHDDGYTEEDQDGLPQPPQHVGFHLTAGASKSPPHSPRLAPARPRWARTASVLVFMHLPYRRPLEIAPALPPSCAGAPSLGAHRVGACLHAFALPAPPRNRPRTPPVLRRRALAGRAPRRCLSSCICPTGSPSKSPPHSPRLAPARPRWARTASVLVFMHLPYRRPLEIAPALPPSCAGAPSLGAHRVGACLHAFALPAPPRNGPRTPPVLRRRALAGRAPRRCLSSCICPTGSPSKSPPHSPRLAPARPRWARTASVLVVMHLPYRLPLEIAPAGAAAAMGEIRRHAA